MQLLLGLFCLMAVVLGFLQAQLVTDPRSSTVRLEKIATQVEHVLVLPDETRKVLTAMMRNAESDCRRSACNASLEQRHLTAIAGLRRALDAKNGTTEFSADRRPLGHDLVTGSISR